MNIPPRFGALSVPREQVERFISQSDGSPSITLPLPGAGSLSPNFSIKGDTVIFNAPWDDNLTADEQAAEDHITLYYLLQAGVPEDKITQC